MSKPFVAGMVAGLFLLTGLLLSAVFYIARVGGDGNGDFTLIVVGLAGSEYEGTCTYTTDILMAPDRSGAVTIRGSVDAAQQPVPYDLTASKIHCEIANLTPEIPMWLELRLDGEQVDLATGSPQETTLTVEYAAP